MPGKSAPHAGCQASPIPSKTNPNSGNRYIQKAFQFASYDSALSRRVSPLSGALRRRKRRGDSAHIHHTKLLSSESAAPFAHAKEEMDTRPVNSSVEFIRASRSYAPRGVEPPASATAKVTVVTIIGFECHEESAAACAMAQGVETKTLGAGS